MIRINKDIAKLTYGTLDNLSDINQYTDLMNMKHLARCHFTVSIRDNNFRFADASDAVKSAVCSVFRGFVDYKQFLLLQCKENKDNIEYRQSCVEVLELEFEQFLKEHELVQWK